MNSMLVNGLCAGVLSSVCAASATAGEIRIVMQYRFGASTNQTLIDLGMPGALVTDTFVAESEDLPVSDDGTTRLFAGERRVVISERSGGLPDLHSFPQSQILRTVDRDAGSSLPDSVLVDTGAVFFDGLVIPPFDDNVVQLPRLEIRAAGTDAFEFDCVVRLGDVLESYNPRVMLPESGFVLSFDAQFGGFSFAIPADPISAVIATGDIEVVTQPMTQVVELGSGFAAFEVVAETMTDVPVISYRWRRDGIELTDGPGVSGSSTPVLVVSTDAVSAGAYECLVTTFGDEVVTRPAALTLTPPAPSPDYNNDGVVDFFDVVDLLADVEAAKP